MGDSIDYQGVHVGWLNCVNTGKNNQGFTIQFNSIDDLVKILSLPNEEVIRLGNCTDVTVQEFKKKYKNSSYIQHRITNNGWNELFNTQWKGLHSSSNYR